MAYEENNPFLGRGMSGGSYDMPNYNVFSGAARKLFPGSGVKSPRRTMDMFKEGRDARPVRQVDEGLEDSIAQNMDVEPPIPDPVGVTPEQTIPVEADLAPPVEGRRDFSPQMDVPVDEGLTPIKGATVEEIEAQRGVELDRRTRERNLNLDYLESADDIGALLEANAKHMDFGDEPVKTLEQTRANVEGQQSAIWTDMMKNKPAALTDEQLLSGRDMLTTLAKQTEELARKIAANPNEATPEMLAQFDKLSDTTAMVHQYMSGKIRTAARALNSMKTISQTMKSGDPMRLVAETSGKRGVERARAVVDAADGSGDPLAVTQAVSDTSWLKGAAQAIVNYRSASILTGFKTQGVNIFNNGFMGGLRTLAVKPAAAAIGTVRTRNTPGADRVYLAETGAEVAGTLHAFTDAFAQAVATWKQGTFANQGEYISPFGGRKVDEAAEQNDRIGTALFGGGAARYTGVPQTLNAWHQANESISFGLLTAGDDFFKVMHYRKSLYSQAIRTAYKEGLEGKKAADRANELLNDITNEMHGAAMKQAEEQTFTNREDVTQGLSKPADFLTKFASDIPLIRMWFPFVRTPTSIFDRAVKMSPLAPIQEAYKRRISQGGPEADMARAEIAVGTTIMGLGALLVAQGAITGNGPSRSSDPTGAQRKGLEATGWQRNSIRVGDKYVSLQRGFDPVMLPTLAVAQIAEAAQYAKTETEAMDYLLGGVIMAASTFVDNTYMQGMKDLMDLMMGRVNYEKYTAQQLGTFAPSLGRDLKELVRMWNDVEGRPIRYNTDNLSTAVMMALQSRIPGMEGGPVARYWDGSIVTAGGGDMLFMYNTMSPIRASWIYNSEGRDADPATRELVDNAVGISQPTPNIVLDQKSGFTINLLNDIPNGTELYEKYLEVVGNNRRRVVEGLINDPQYQNLVDDGLTGPNSYAAMYLGRAVSMGLSNGKEEFLDMIRDPDFDLEKYGPAAEIIRGDKLSELLTLSSEDSLLKPERDILLTGKVKGLKGREGLAPPEGSGSKRTKEWVPLIK